MTRVERIAKILAFPGEAAFYSDDKAAILAGAPRDGHFYGGVSVSPGFSSVRHPGESTCILILGQDGNEGRGDAVTCQYSGVGGRNPRFQGEEAASKIRRLVEPSLVDFPLGSFKEAAMVVRNLTDNDGSPLHPGIRYGITQAILTAVAASKKQMPAEILAEEYDLVIGKNLIPVFAQTGDDPFVGVDKSIMRRVEAMPHGLINTVAKFGDRGERLTEYAQWIVSRLARFGASDYVPRLHFDCYGTPGIAFEHDLVKLSDYLAGLGEMVAPYPLLIEMPVDAGSMQAQLEVMGTLRTMLRQKGSQVRLVVDEWANTSDEIKEWADAGQADLIHLKCPDIGGLDEIIETLIYCKEKGLDVYLGGTCNETETCAQICAHLAMATSPYQMLAKPGMGIDEGVSIVRNEMHRIINRRIAMEEREVFQ